MKSVTHLSRRIAAFQKVRFLRFGKFSRNNLCSGIVALAALLSGSAISSRAATVNWITNVTDIYTNKADWSTGNLPGVADTAAIGNATVTSGSVIYTNNPGDPPPTNAITSLLLGATSSTTGTFTMNNGTLSITNTAGAILVPGNASSSTGTFVMNGGTLNVVRNTANFFQDGFTPGNATGSTGTFTLNGGTATFLCGIELGIQGPGTLNVTGGTLIDNGWFGVGRGNGSNAPAQGFFNQSGGTVYLLRNPGTDTGINGLAFCQQGTNAVVSISGGSLYCNGIRFGAANVNGGRTTYETLNFSGGDIYVSGLGVFTQAGGGTHNITVNLSGGTFHTVDLGPNTGGTQGLASVLTDGTNWTWNIPATANLNTSPGSGTVTFAPDTNRTITLTTAFTGSGNLAMSGPGTLAINSANTYSGNTTITGGTVSGTGTVQGAVSASSGATIAPGTSLTPGTLTLGSSLTLNGDTNIFKLSGGSGTIGSGVNDLLVANGGLSLQGVSTVSIVPLSPLDTSAPYTVLQYSGTPLTSGDAAHLHVVSTTPRYSVSLIDPSSTPGSLQVQMTGNPASLVWKGGVAGNPTAWDNTTTNWLNTGTSSLDKFFTGDAVTFDDTANTNLANVVGVQLPASILMNNNAKAYTFTGGTLAADLDLEGTNSLTLMMSNTPSFNSITNNAGVLVFNLQNSGSNRISAPITDNGAGNGRIVQGGTNILVLLADNTSFHGAIYVTNGVLQYTNANALGNTNAPAQLYVTNGATLDLNGVTPGAKSFTVSGNGYNGQGAINNSSGTGIQNTAGITGNLTLTGDTTFAASNRWDSTANTFNGNGFNLTHLGPGTIILSDEHETSLGNLHVTAGRFGFQGNITMGDTTKTATIESNAVLTFFGLSNSSSTNSGQTKNLVLNSGVLDSGGSSNNFNGPVTLSGTALIGTRSTLHIWGAISGSGGFAMGNDSVGTNNADLYIDGTNTYSGPTTISNRTLFVGVNSSLGSSSLVLVLSGAKLDVTSQSSYQFNTGVLAGTGTVNGNTVVMGTGSALAPGTAGTNPASLTMNGNLTLQPGSTNVAVVNKTGSIASSKVIGLTSVSIGGTLVVSNFGNALASGDAIPLFSATSYSGGYNQIIPATPGTGLAWDSSTLTADGNLRVKTGGPPSTPTNITFSVSSGQLTLSWPSNYTGWGLQTQTNAVGTAGIKTNWVTVVGATNTNQVVFPISPTNGSAYYRMFLPQ